jgi:DNA polymerase (family 10)
MAKEEGALVAINSDAHSVHDFANLPFGVGQARRGWLEARDVLNARPLAELRKLLAPGATASAAPRARRAKR